MLRALPWRAATCSTDEDARSQWVKVMTNGFKVAKLVRRTPKAAFKNSVPSPFADEQSKRAGRLSKDADELVCTACCEDLQSSASAKGAPGLGKSLNR